MVGVVKTFMVESLQWFECNPSIQSATNHNVDVRLEYCFRKTHKYFTPSIGAGNYHDHHLVMEIPPTIEVILLNLTFSIDDSTGSWQLLTPQVCVDLVAHPIPSEFVDLLSDRISVVLNEIVAKVVQLKPTLFHVVVDAAIEVDHNYRSWPASDVVSSSSSHHQTHSSVIDNLETREFSSAGEQFVACSICLEEFSRGMKVTITPCSHVFHRQCIAKWLNRKNTCPVCRFEMK